MNGDDQDVEVQFMDGEIRAYLKVIPAREDGCLVLRATSYYGSTPRIRYVLPLANIREVKYK